MQITASMVKDLRERTGAGMMECKKALTETGGDMKAAVELMRKQGLAKADRKAGRIAAEGVIAAAVTDNRAQAALVEVNSETDFVAKGDDFQNFARALADQVLTHRPADLEALNAMPMNGGSSVETARQKLVAKLGENIQVRRFESLISDGGHIGSYLHGSRIGVLVEMKGGDADLARDVAMHVAASRPVCVDEQQVPETLLGKEREIIAAQSEQSGKPPEIIEKMVAGRLKKYLGEITLLGQPFVKDPDQSVGKLLKANNAGVARFVRFEVGEGIEKKSGDFASEVMAQVKGE